MTITYDAKVDGLYIGFRDTKVTSKEPNEGTAVDLDAEGRLAGVETPDAVARSGGKKVFRQITLGDIALGRATAYSLCPPLTGASRLLFPCRSLATFDLRLATPVCPCLRPLDRLSYQEEPHACRQAQADLRAGQGRSPEYPLQRRYIGYR